MTEYSGPFESSGTGLQESDWLELEDTVYPYSGYVGNYGGELAVSQHSPLAAMSVDVATGAAIVKSSRYRNTAVKTVTVDAADSTQDRYDLIVIQRTLNAPASGIIVTVHKGTLYTAGTAVPPTRTTSATVHELVLAQVFVAHGTTAITTAMITDKRTSVDCGVYSPAVGGLTIDEATGNFDFDGQKLTNIADPVDDTDGDTKGARDAAIVDAVNTFSGRLLGVTILSTTGSGTFTTSALTHHIRLVVIGPGGADGSGYTAYGNSPTYYQSAGRGAPGAWLKMLFLSVDPNTGYAYTVGAVGAASSTISINSVNYTAASGGAGGNPAGAAVGAAGTAAMTPTCGDLKSDPCSPGAGGLSVTSPVPPPVAPAVYHTGLEWASQYGYSAKQGVIIIEEYS